MKIKVKNDICQGHARCYAVSPALFVLDDSGYIVPGDIDVPKGHELLARRGARACPERALEIAEDDDADD